jgi:hypothetical protein
MAKKVATHHGQTVRVIDPDGAQSNMGLLQIRTDDGFGTVCGLDHGAADLVCRMMGYDYGTVGSSSCSSYAGKNVCGAPGSSVAVQALSCQEGGINLDGCHWHVPDASCLSHELDSVVFCGSQSSLDLDGSLRLVAYDGAPSSDGTGRLDILLEGHWAPICSEGFSAGAATVACKQMGFTGAEHLLDSSCFSVSGRNFCSMSPHMSDLACSGKETNLMSCPFEKGLDVFCAPNEAVVLSCLGDGDAQGRPTMAAEQ